MHKRTAIVVFARAPESERKRLGLGARAERRLHGYLLRRTLEIISSVGDADVVLASAGRVDSSHVTHQIDQQDRLEGLSWQTPLAPASKRRSML